MSTATEPGVIVKSLATGRVVPGAIVNVSVANGALLENPTTTGGIVPLVFAVKVSNALPGLGTLATMVGRGVIVVAAPDNTSEVRVSPLVVENVTPASMEPMPGAVP